MGIDLFADQPRDRIDIRSADEIIAIRDQRIAELEAESRLQGQTIDRCSIEILKLTSERDTLLASVATLREALEAAANRIESIIETEPHLHLKDDLALYRLTLANPATTEALERVKELERKRLSQIINALAAENSQLRDFVQHDVVGSLANLPNGPDDRLEQIKKLAARGVAVYLALENTDTALERVRREAKIEALEALAVHQRVRIVPQSRTEYSATTETYVRWDAISAQIAALRGGE